MYCSSLFFYYFLL